MSDIFICKHCGKELNVKQFGRHLWKVHKQRYEDYVKNHLDAFKHLGWKNCVECGEICKSTSDKCGKCYTKNHQINDDQQIQCKHCSNKIHSKVFSQHLNVYHNIEFKDYVKDNLNDFRKFGWCNCVICGNICVNRSKIHNNPTCSSECLAKVRKTWIGDLAPRFGAILSNETKQRISISNTGHEGLKGDLNPARRPEVREQISKTRIERGVAKGENNPMFGKTHTPEAIKKIFSHRSMNKLEKMVADELDKAGVSYYFQFFITENGICKSYDFKIRNKPLIIEVDGDFWHGNPKQTNHYEKVNEVKMNDIFKEQMASRLGYKVIRIWESDIKKDPSHVIKIIQPLLFIGYK